MSGERAGSAERLEAYVEGSLGAAERAAFERDMLRDPALRAEVETQQRIDDRLRAIFAPPVPAGAPGAPPRPVAPWTRLALGLAAALALAAAGAYWAGLLGRGPGDTRADALYARLVRTGFEPAWVCGDDAEFVAYTRDTFGQAFTIEPAPGVELLGWTYCSGVLGDGAGVLLATVGGDRAIVIVDRSGNDRRVPVDAGSGLRVFRARAGGAVLYEVTPRDSPALLPRVRLR